MAHRGKYSPLGISVKYQPYTEKIISQAESREDRVASKSRKMRLCRPVCAGRQSRFAMLPLGDFDATLAGGHAEVQSARLNSKSAARSSRLGLSQPFVSVGILWPSVGPHFLHQEHEGNHAQGGDSHQPEVIEESKHGGMAH